MRIMKSFFVILAASLVIVLNPAVAEASHSYTYSSFPHNKLVGNAVFLRTSSMNTSEIQDFLDGKGGELASKTFSGKTAAEIIYEVANDYGINPQVIIATLQKEQSLITDPSPHSSQYESAMGYGCPTSGGCDSKYAGFINQVDNGTWQLRLNYERASGNDTWWNSDISYVCSNASTYYNNGLFPGNTVGFRLSDGTVYRTTTLANAASASLYCYTPHAYSPYYNGSYNFVVNFEHWFGSITATEPWLYELISLDIYSDASRTMPLVNNVASLDPGETAYAHLRIRNVGYKTWENSFLKLGTQKPRDHHSDYSDMSWLSPGRAASIDQASVPSGDTADIYFTLTAPSDLGIGEFKEYFRPVAESRSWLKGDLILVRIRNVDTATPRNFDTTLNAGEQLVPGSVMVSKDQHRALVFHNNGNVVLYSDFKEIWSTDTKNSSATRLVMQGDGNLVLYASGGSVLWSSGTSGNNGARFDLQNNGNLEVLDADDSVLWSSDTIVHPDGLDYVVQQLINIGKIYPGQQLETPNRAYRLFLQSDGNLVIYSKKSGGNVVWATGTNGLDIRHLALQGDGNLVLYSTSGPVWSSRTNGKSNPRLILQSDGNLVMYRNGKAIWDSGTRRK